MLDSFKNNPLDLAKASKATHSMIEALTRYKCKSNESLCISFEKTEQGFFVHKDGVVVAVMPSERFTRVALLEQIIDRAKQLAVQAMSSFDQRFIERLRFDAPYRIKHDLQHDLRWIETTGSNHSSLFLDNPNVDMYEPEQLSAEFRIFLDEPRAHLFLTYGQQYEFRSTPLLSGSEPFIRADTFEQLSEKVACVYNQASAKSWDRLGELGEHKHHCAHTLAPHA